MNSNASSDANDGHQDLGMYADSESIKSNNSKNGILTQYNSFEIHQTKENNNQPIKKIHHNLSSFSELGDFLSESAPNAPVASSSMSKENNLPKPKPQSQKKKKPFKRQPIKIDFSKIFSQDNNFNFLDEPKENNADIANINSNISFASGENESTKLRNQSTKDSIDFDQQNKENEIKIDSVLEDIENRIIDYFNRSLNFMISDFTNDLRDILSEMNITDSLLQSFGMDLKKNIRHIINFKSNHSDIIDMNSIDSTLLSYKSFLLDINYFYPNRINEINDSINDCKKSVSSQINKINTEITPSINEFQNELSELHQLQQSILQKEAKSDYKRSSIFQRLADLEYCETMQKTESELLSLKRSRSNFSVPKVNEDYDKKEFLNQIYKFLRLYKRFQNNTQYKDIMRRYSKQINNTFDELQNACDIYNLKIRNIFSSLNYIQNQKNMTFISNIRNSMINDQLAMHNNTNLNNVHNITDANTNENIKINTINTSQKLKEIDDINKKKKTDYFRNNEKHKNEIRYIEDLRRHDHRRVHHKSSK